MAYRVGDYQIASNPERIGDGEDYDVVWRAFQLVLDEHGEECWAYVDGTASLTREETESFLKEANQS
jgi:hypothetical protein